MSRSLITSSGSARRWVRSTALVMKVPVLVLALVVYPFDVNMNHLCFQGLYDSIRDASSLQRPIYITETGCADREGRYRRQLIEGHCSTVLRSIADGFDVRGM